MTPNPIAMGLLLCDYAVVEEVTRKVTLAGEFTSLWAEEFPMPPRDFCAYSVLSDGVGRGTIELVVTHLDSDDELLTLRRECEFTDKLARVRVLYWLREFSFPAPGIYELAILVDREPITRCRLSVFQVEEE